MERVEVLNEYYTNLDYDKIDKEKVLEKIDNLSKIVFDSNVDIPQRLKQLSHIVQKNLSLFASVCTHIDIINSIKDYLNNYAIKIDTGLLDGMCNSNEVLVTLIMTLVNFHLEDKIQRFMIYPMITNSLLEFFQEVDPLIQRWSELERIHTDYKEMIILEDSDLYAVTNCLMITHYASVHKIWVQEQVVEKFLWLTKNYRYYLDILVPICTFQLVKDIEFCARHHTVNSVSIWSEDVAAAKNLALALNCHIVYINTHMDHHGGIMLLPHKKVLDQRVNDLAFKQNIQSEKDSDLIDIKQSVNTVTFSHTAEMKSTSICNLFYDGTWQKPVKGMYWKHNDSLWANATNEDILRCYESAEKAFKTWGIKSIRSRTQILSKFEPILKLTGKLVLAAIIARWIQFPYLNESLRGCLTPDATLEVIHSRKPLGIIVLREENENVLFFRLMQTLIAGNCVIVMFSANFCNLASYCDMFSTCGIPPGVINLLSHENIDTLEYKLCSTKYTDYANKFFLKGDSKDTYILPYKNLTMPKYIILRLK